MTDYAAAPFLAVAPNYFGKGFTPAEAKANLKAEGGKLTKYIVYRLPEGARSPFVDAFGQLHWTWADGADRSAQPAIVARRGVPA